MSGKLRVSVAMAVYNGARFIGEQLESFLRQTRLPDELVVSDNGSSDGTVELVREFARRAPFEVKLNVNEANLGVAKNFERAFLLCTGDVVFFSDCDDVWLPRKIELMCSVFEQYPSVGMVICNSLFVDEELRSLKRTTWYNEPRDSYIRAGASVVKAVVSSAPSVYGHNLAIRTSLRDAVIPIPDSDVFNSWDIWIILTAGLKADLYALKQVLALYRQHPFQVSPPELRGKPIIQRTLVSKLQTRARPVPSSSAVAFWTDFLEGVRRRWGQSPESLKALAVLEGFCEHLAFRTGILNLPYPRRLAEILRRTIRGEYHRFGRGLLSAARDLVVAHNFSQRSALLQGLKDADRLG